MFIKKAVSCATLCLGIAFSLSLVITSATEAAWKSSGLYDQGGVNRQRNELGKTAILRDQKMYQVVELDSGGYERAMLYAYQVGAHLAVIDSFQKNKMLFDYLLSLNIKSAYFGLVYNDLEKGWRDARGFAPRYVNWSGGEPYMKEPSYRYAKLNTIHKDGLWTTGPFNKFIDPKEACYFILEWDKAPDKQ